MSRTKGLSSLAREAFCYSYFTAVRTNMPSSVGRIAAGKTTSTPARILRLFIPSLITTPGRTGAMKTTNGIAVSMMPAVSDHFAYLLPKIATVGQVIEPISTGQMKE